MTRSKMPLHAPCAQGKVQAVNLDFLEADGVLDFCGKKIWSDSQFKNIYMHSNNSAFFVL